MGQSRKDNPDFYQGTDINGNKTWKRVQGAQRTANVFAGGYGFGAADDFLNHSAKMPVRLDQDPQTEQQRKQVKDLLSNMDNLMKGMDSPYHPRNMNKNDPDHKKKVSQKDSLLKGMDTELDTLNTKHNERMAELNKNLSGLENRPVNGTEEDKAVSAEKKRLTNAINQENRDYDYEKTMILDSYNEVAFLRPELKNDYARGAMRSMLYNDAIVHTIMHDPESFNSFYDKFIEPNHYDLVELGDEFRDEINKNFLRRYGMTFVHSEDTGTFVPKIHNQGDDFSEHLHKAKHAELLQEWSGTQNEGVYWGNNFIKSGDITSSVIRERRLRTIRIATRIALFRYAQHRMNRRIYGKNYRPYIRYRDELKRFQRDVDRDLRKTEIKDTVNDED